MTLPALELIVRVGLASLLLTSAAALANSASLPPRGQDYASPFMRVFGLTQPPYGFVNFCERMPQECAQGAQEEQRFFATPARLKFMKAASTETAHVVEAVLRLALAHPEHGPQG